MKRLFYTISTLVILASCNPSAQQGNTPVAEEDMVRSKEFTKINPKEAPGNAIQMISDGWMLITAGNKETYNTMTASWGTLGSLWSKSVATCFINPARYTYGFMEDAEYYTLCFFDEEYRPALSYCGTKSGRDHTEQNKAEAAGLTPQYTELGSVYFKEAYLVLECKKIYAQQFEKSAFTAEVNANADPEGEPWIINDTEDFHKFFIGEIVNCWIRN